MLLCTTFQSTSAEVLINEIFFDPPDTAGDFRSEYIELRGTSGQSLANHYLILLENETGLTGPEAGTQQGRIDNIFDLTTTSLGSNGFLTIRQAGNFFNAPAAGTTDLVNTGASFTFGSGVSSTVGHSDQGNDGVIENSGFTAWLINIGSGAAPLLNQDLDQGDNGLSDDTLPAGWTILDAIGVNSEISDADGRLYADINFSAGNSAGGPNIEPDATFINVGYEIEYIGRWGDSTGSTRADWHATNVTNNTLTGFAGPADFRQSGAFHDTGGTDNFVETTQGVPYGTELNDTLGASNLFLKNADFDFDKDIDGADFLAWQRGLGFGDGDDATRIHGDTHDEEGVLDRIVDGLDLARWQEAYGSGAATTSALFQVIPEPSSFALCALAVSLLLPSRQRRS